MLSPSIGTLLQILLLWWNFQRNPLGLRFFFGSAPKVHPPARRTHPTPHLASAATQLKVAGVSAHGERPSVIVQVRKHSPQPKRATSRLLYFAFGSRREGVHEAFSGPAAIRSPPDTSVLPQIREIDGGQGSHPCRCEILDGFRAHERSARTVRTAAAPRPYKVSR